MISINDCRLIKSNKSIKNSPNNRMQSDFGKRYALTSAADARRYVAHSPQADD